MKKELIFGLLLVVLVGGFLFWQSQKKQPINFSSKNNQEKSQITKNQNQPTVSNNKKITMEELAKHNSPSDCWLLIDGKVYDVTNYIDSHPGGRIMVNFCGQDATQAFNTKGQKGKPHKPVAYEALKNLYIGDLR